MAKLDALLIVFVIFLFCNSIFALGDKYVYQRDGIPTKVENGINVTTQDFDNIIYPDYAIHRFFMNVSGTNVSEMNFTADNIQTPDVNISRAYAQKATFNASWYDEVANVTWKNYNLGEETNQIIDDNDNLSIYVISIETDNWVSESANITVDNLSIDPSLGACGTLASAGTYNVTGSFTGASCGACLIIGADNITIAGNNNIITGKACVDGVSYGLSDNGKNNLDIENLSIGASNNTATGVTSDGMMIINANNVTIKNSFIYGGDGGTSPLGEFEGRSGGNGLVLSNVNNSLLFNLTLSGGYGTRYQATGGCRNAGNGGDALRILLTSNNITVSNGTMTGGHGGYWNDLAGNGGTGGYGIYASTTGGKHNIENNTITGGVAGGDGGQSICYCQTTYSGYSQTSLYESSSLFNTIIGNTVVAAGTAPCGAAYNYQTTKVLTTNDCIASNSNAFGATNASTRIAFGLGLNMSCSYKNTGWWGYPGTNGSSVSAYFSGTGSGSHYFNGTTFSQAYFPNGAVMAINSARISPSPNATTLDTLIGFCNASSTPSANLTYNYKWFVNNVLNLTGTTSLNYTSGLEINVANITSGNLSAGQNWSIECVGNTSGTLSSALNSSNTTIILGVPTIVSSRFSPTNASVTDNLLGYCNATVPIGNITAYFYQIYLNDTPNASGSVTNGTYGFISGYEINIVNITNSSLLFGQNWTLQCIANNTLGNSSALNSTTDYINIGIPPVIASARISPSPNAHLSDTLIGYCNATDFDSSLIGYNVSWYKNGILNRAFNTTINYVQGLEVNVDNLTSGNLTAGDNWTLKCIANDGILNSSSITSSPTYIMIPPHVNSLYTSPVSPIAIGSTSSCKANVTQGDYPITSVNFTITSANLSSIIINQNGTHIGDIWTSPSFSANLGGTWQCLITASDTLGNQQFNATTFNVSTYLNATSVTNKAIYNPSETVAINVTILNNNSLPIPNAVVNITIRDPYNSVVFSATNITADINGKVYSSFVLSSTQFNGTYVLNASASDPSGGYLANSSTTTFNVSTYYYFIVSPTSKSVNIQENNTMTVYYTLKNLGNMNLTAFTCNSSLPWVNLTGCPTSLNITQELSITTFINATLITPANYTSILNFSETNAGLQNATLDIEVFPVPVPSLELSSSPLLFTLSIEKGTTYTGQFNITNTGNANATDIICQAVGDISAGWVSFNQTLITNIIPNATASTTFNITPLITSSRGSYTSYIECQGSNTQQTTSTLLITVTGGDLTATPNPYSISLSSGSAQSYWFNLQNLGESTTGSINCTATGTSASWISGITPSSITSLTSMASTSLFFTVTAPSTASSISTTAGITCTGNNSATTENLTIFVSGTGTPTAPGGGGGAPAVIDYSPKITPSSINETIQIGQQKSYTIEICNPSSSTVSYQLQTTKSWVLVSASKVASVSPNTCTNISLTVSSLLGGTDGALDVLTYLGQDLKATSELPITIKQTLETKQISSIQCMASQNTWVLGLIAVVLAGIAILSSRMNLNNKNKDYLYVAYGFAILAVLTLGFLAYTLLTASGCSTTLPTTPAQYNTLTNSSNGTLVFGNPTTTGNGEILHGMIPITNNYDEEVSLNASTPDYWIVITNNQLTIPSRGSGYLNYQMNTTGISDNGVINLQAYNSTGGLLNNYSLTVLKEKTDNSNLYYMIGIAAAVIMFIGAFVLSRINKKSIMIIIAVALGIIIILVELGFYIWKPVF